MSYEVIVLKEGYNRTEETGELIMIHCTRNPAFTFTQMVYTFGKGKWNVCNESIYYLRKHRFGPPPVSFFSCLFFPSNLLFQISSLLFQISNLLIQINNLKEQISNL